MHNQLSIQLQTFVIYYVEYRFSVCISSKHRKLIIKTNYKNIFLPINVFIIIT